MLSEGCYEYADTASVDERDELIRTAVVGERSARRTYLPIIAW